MEFPKLKQRHWGRHFWAIVFGAQDSGLFFLEKS
ncbi:hypothetical protein U0010_11750 [Myroides odoratus]|nr:hypothetical protein [Myroides odoratus]WQD56200.1 hypothetical protein U0010_11750 [Myroides odoratus]